MGKPQSKQRANGAQVKSNRIREKGAKRTRATTRRSWRVSSANERRNVGS